MSIIKRKKSSTTSNRFGQSTNTSTGPVQSASQTLVPGQAAPTSAQLPEHSAAVQAHAAALQAPRLTAAEVAASGLSESAATTPAPEVDEPAPRRSMLRSKLMLVATIGVMSAVAIACLSLYSAALYNDALQETNETRQAAIQGSVIRSLSGQTLEKQTALALAVYRDGAQTADPTSNERVGLVNHLETTSKAFTEMPTNQLNSTESERYNEAKSSWQNFRIVSNEIQTLLIEGNPNSLAQADKLRVEQAVPAAAEVNESLSQMITAVNERVDGVERDVRSETRMLQLTEAGVLAITILLLVLVFSWESGRSRRTE